MTHLTPDQFVDAIENDLDRHPGAAAHLAACEACRADVANLTETMDVARSVALPEPSPLFWEHFSRRVRAAVEADPVPQRAGLGKFLLEGWRPVAATSVVAAALVLAVVLRPADRFADQRTGQTQEATLPALGVTPVAAVATADSATADEARLNVAAALVQDLKTEELQQVARPSADATGAAMEDLTPAQCAELMRLIKTQMIGAE